MAESIIDGEDVKEVRNAIAEVIFDLRKKELNMTMRKTARLIGTSHSFIGKVEQNTRKFCLHEFILYCQKLDKEPVEVLEQILGKLK